MSTETRIEKDLLGEREIPLDAYWGIHTLRAYENFPLSGRRVHPDLIKALAKVKKACCQANTELGYLDQSRAYAIVKTCDEIIDGQWAEQFIVDALQGGAGTSTNMNINEVIANRALELLGERKGDYDLLHPLDTVNLHQSTNDVYPTALRAAAIDKLRTLNEAITDLQGAFQSKEREFAPIVKIGRTERQEAVPMTLGMEFSAFAEALARDRWRTFKCEERIRTVNIGGTAIGTGLTAPQKYIFLVIEKLKGTTQLGLARAENLVDATANSDALVEVSGILKAHAQNILKISNDLRLLQLLKEIILPACQAGSSVMPGKVNPVILEAAHQAALTVMANDRLVTDAAAQASLQINEFMPLLADALLHSLDLLVRTNRMLSEHVRGIEAALDVCLKNAEQSPALITAFVPVIGYAEATRIIREFQQSDPTSLRALLADQLGEELTGRILSPQNLTALGFRDHE